MEYNMGMYTVATCEYCGLSQKLTDVWLCQKCGAPLSVSERPSLLQRITSASPAPEFSEGIDVSKWQGNMDWSVAKPLIDYAIIKASENVTEDSKYQQNVDGCEEQEIIYGVYHFCRPQYSWQSQAQFFSDRVVGLLPAWVDIESTGGLTPYNLQQWLYNFVSAVEDATGKEVGIYTRGAWWNSYVGRNTWAGDHPLWISRFNSYITGPWSDGKYRPYEWTDWVFWQWSADGNGEGSKYGAESNSIDKDRFNGTSDDFFEWVGGPSPPIVCPNEQRVTDLETGVSTLWVEIVDIKARLDALENPPLVDTLTVEVNAGDKAVVFETVGYDKVCPGKEPPGKPIAEPPKKNRIVYDSGQTFKIKAKAFVSCKDNRNDHIVKGSGYDFAIVADGQPGEGNFVRLDKVTILS